MYNIEVNKKERNVDQLTTGIDLLTLLLVCIRKVLSALKCLQVAK